MLMRKIHFWGLLLGLALGSLAFTSCGDDDDDTPKPPPPPTTNNVNDSISTANGNDTTKVTPPTLEVNEANLRGTWDGSVDADFAQGYYQRWRLHFDGEAYTSWHTHLVAGSIYDDEQGIKTVGNKTQGTWKYQDGKLILTPVKMWASYVITSMNPTKYTYYNYNPETMECDSWYETPEILVQQGVERDLEDGINGNEFYIQAWPVLGLTDALLSVKINMDVFILTKQ